MSPDREDVYNRRSELMFAEVMCLADGEPIVVHEPIYREKPVGEDEVPPFTRFDGFAFAAMKWHFEKRKEKLSD